MSVATQDVEVLPAETLETLAAEANREHELAYRAGQATLRHAIRAGVALLAAHAQFDALMPSERNERGGWEGWCEQNLEIAIGTAYMYERLARFQDEIEKSGASSIKEARKYLTAGGAADRRGGTAPIPSWAVEHMQKMRQEGASKAAIAEAFGVSVQTVYRKTNPGANERHRQQQRRREEARQAERERKRERAIRSAVRKAGGAISEAYSQAERMQDILGQAHREAESAEARAALTAAGEHYRKARDEIVKALGVMT